MRSRDDFTRLGDGNRIAAKFNEGMNRGLATGLRTLAAALAGSEVAENAQALLPHAIRQADRFGITRIAIADACQVSEATVSRWASGQIKPHVIMARAAIGEICKIAAQNALRYEETAAAVERVR
jgi:DNA-binding transcriptional regulator YiaG